MKKKSKIRQGASLILIFFLATLMTITFFNLPEVEMELSNYYITEGVEDTGAINLITAILFDYRGFDTLGEATVIFAAACSVAFLVSKDGVSMISAKFSLIVQQSISFIMPFLFLFSFYLIAFGHLSPGGGFTGGVVMAAIVISLTVIFGIKYSDQQIKSKYKTFLESFGAIGFLLGGMAGIFLGGNFLANGQIGVYLGTPGSLYSGGLIPYINLMTGLKVAAGLSIIFTSLIKEE